MIVHRLPRRTVRRQLPPLAARPHDIQNPIHDLFLGMLVATAAPITGLKVVRNLFPVGGFSVARITHQVLLLTLLGLDITRNSFPRQLLRKRIGRHALCFEVADGQAGPLPAKGARQGRGVLL
jgi:hypothetical protein